MSITGYFVRRTAEFRMPKKADPLDIRFEGPVLTGEKSVQQRQREETILACNTTLESYKSTEDYDPVLRAHLNLTSSDERDGRRPKPQPR